MSSSSSSPSIYSIDDFLRIIQTNRQTCLQHHMDWPEPIWHRLASFLLHLQQYNQQVNLISYHSAEELFWNHLIDSLMPLSYFKEVLSVGGKWLDIGAGGGFPGVPLALACPSIELFPVESIQKKQVFLQESMAQSGLKGQAFWTRAEVMGQDLAHREKYSGAFCRAVSRWPTVLELTLPLIHVDGFFIAHRGVDAPEEIEKQKDVLDVLGGVVCGVERYQLPGHDRPRYLVKIKKTKPTPQAYPRRPGVPAKKPL